MISSFATIFFGFLVFVYFFLNRKLNYWKIRNVPYIEPKFLYGNARGIVKDYHPGEFWRTMCRMLKPKGPIGGAYMFIQPFAVITDLDLMKEIMIKDFNFFTNRVGYFNEKDDPISAHIINLEGESWKDMRKKISPTFAGSKLKMMFSELIEISMKLVALIDKDTFSKKPIDVGDLLPRFVTDILGLTEFGIYCNSMEDRHSKFYEMALKDFASFSFLRRMLLWTFRDLGRRLHFVTTDKEIGNFYSDVIGKLLQHRKDNPQLKRQDLVSVLTKLKDSNTLSFQQIAAQAYVFSVAGIETTAAAITFCMFELSINDDIRKKARQSIYECLKKHDGCLTYEALNEMHYLQQCIHEAIRKYPPVPTITRVANADYKIANTNITIEKGTSMVCSIYSIHTDPEIYPDPDKYDPDRFLPEEIEKRHPLSFIPFGNGPRGCMAPRYANLLIKIALVKILTNFDFKLDHEKTMIPLKMAPKKLVFWPNNEIFINFTKI
ncbi:probable cytochrome P450 6a14 [Bradysia coprophila]|uniref:probable cytochrome P450 6a14 n=1 Tax=Bradysia coprophila TaxID=38358 RepID=UPI00187D76D4|nr:probable cytochrome P450 6a14 [Bradysia coprophila]